MIFAPNWAAPASGVTASQSRTAGTAQAGLEVSQFGTSGPAGTLTPFGSELGTGGSTTLSAPQRWTTSAGDSGWEVYCDSASGLITGSVTNTWLSCDVLRAWVVSRTVPSYGTNSASGLLRFRKGGIEYGSVAFTISATAIAP